MSVQRATHAAALSGNSSPHRPLFPSCGIMGGDSGAKAVMYLRIPRIVGMGGFPVECEAEQFRWMITGLEVDAPVRLRVQSGNYHRPVFA
ncbi:MAG: hypothetical protein AVO35_05965 [Candidatus Aegiribacteria sp. MLS_C]|nr:MAG: hypothetical protein AVO35_05965 [Candidatus Aegiribacteria sp. MLS_C]